VKGTKRQIERKKENEKKLIRFIKELKKKKNGSI